MPLSCSMELYNMWNCYSYRILLEKLLEDVLISSDKNYCSTLIFHLFHNDTSNHTLVMYINISSFEISLWCQKVISIQTGLVRKTSTKIHVLLNNQLKKKISVFTIVLSSSSDTHANKKVCTWRTLLTQNVVGLYCFAQEKVKDTTAW